MKKAVTIKDIATRLNMSFSTVSKALNNDPTISKLTKERVKKQAAEWNYIPNEAARHFKLNKTFTLGLIIPDLLDQFFVQAINGVEKIASEEKYNVIVSQSHENPQKEEHIIDLMKRNRVDGVIVVITKKSQEMTTFHNLQEIGIPVVFIARPPHSDAFHTITSDNEGGAFQATEYLISCGHKRIAHLMGPAALSVTFSRLKGYRSALRKYKIKYDEDLVKTGDFTKESTYNAMESLMTTKLTPSAIFTFKNYITLDAMEYLKKAYPEKLDEIAFAGFGNLPLFEYLDHKPVASIEERSYEMGEAAARLVFKMIKMEAFTQPKKGTHIQIPCKLIIHQ